MREAHEPLVSVLTPLYNGQPYLRECIESVLAQTYGNWVHVIVNNCSTDGSLEIAREYAARSDRIRVISNESFVKVIANHNIAFRQVPAEAKYCKVVYADDWIFPECLSRMVALAEDHPGVGLVAAYGLRGAWVDWDGLSYTRTVIDGREACRERLLGGPYLFGTPTSVLYRADLVREKEAFFNESNLHADKEACFEILQKSDLGFVHQVLSFTRMDNETLTAFSLRFNTYMPGVLRDLVQYGPKLLSAEELRARLDGHLATYYEYLAERFLAGSRREFWQFHSAKLRDLGYPLSKPRLALAVLASVADRALNPKRTIEGILRRLARRDTGSRDR